jgi:coenzyme PQQ precursor peptide PqqA
MALMGGGGSSRTPARSAAPALRNRPRSDTMNWTKPQATDLRYGFEITMYISAR